MANFYIADTHFGHENVIRFDDRPFVTIDEMDRMMIEYWNMRVSENDDVYILGDFCFKSKKSALWYLKRLNGRKHLIRGNHDSRWMKKEPEALAEFESVEDIGIVRDGKHTLILSHYPMAEWNMYYSGSYMVYGHVHNNMKHICEYALAEDRALNAGCMINNYMPVTFEELIENNQMFKCRNEWAWKLYGDSRGPKELDSGRWIAPTKWHDGSDFMESGGIHWTFGEFFKSGLIYHFCTEASDDVDHEHSFEGVMVAACEYPDSFRIPEEYLKEYSEQELSYLDVIVERMKEDV